MMFHVAVFLWGFTGVLGRLISLDEMSLVVWRTFIATCTIWMICPALNRWFQKYAPNLVVAPTAQPSPWYRKCLPGAVLGLHWFCFYGSIKYSNVSIALTCLSTAALIASMMEPWINKTKFSSQNLFLGIVVMLGMALVFYAHLQFSFGVVYGLVSTVLTVLVSVLNKRLVNSVAPLELVKWQMLGAFGASLICMPIYINLFAYRFRLPSGTDILYLLILTWVCTLLTYFIWMTALRRISAFTSNLILTLEPVYGIVMAFIVFQEYLELSPYFYLGFVSIVTSVFFHTIQQNRFRKRSYAISE